MRSITVKLVLAFLFIGLISICSIVLLARQTTRSEFNRFIVSGRGESLVTELMIYYHTRGSWEEVNTFLSHQEGGTPYPAFTIASNEGIALIDGGGYRAGDSIPSPELELGIPMSVDGQIVGVLVMEHTPFPDNPREVEFIQRINRFLIFSGVGAGLIALILGIILSQTIARPLRELTKATQAVSEGNLNQQLPVRSNDEIGELTSAFNRMSAELSRSVNARRQMTADIAHELRTPLSLILGHAEAVHDGVLPPSTENFEIIREEAARLDHLVDDLRTLSLADAGELSLAPQLISPEKLLQEVAALYHLQTHTKAQNITMEIQPSLPNIPVDPGRMTQVLRNLIDNAVRHTPEGGTITLASRATAAGAVEFRVSDTGPGLSSEDLTRIFDRFYRADEARRRDEGGSGLGLAIAKSIVIAQGGQIHAESEPGKGLSVIISLPAKPH